MSGVGVAQLVELLLNVVIAGIIVSLLDVVADMIDVQLVRDQAVQAVGVVDAVRDDIASELDEADQHEGDGHQEEADEEGDEFPGPGGPFSFALFKRINLLLRASAGAAGNPCAASAPVAPGCQCGSISFAYHSITEPQARPQVFRSPGQRRLPDGGQGDLIRPRFARPPSGGLPARSR